MFGIATVGVHGLTAALLIGQAPPPVLAPVPQAPALSQYPVPVVVPAAPPPAPPVQVVPAQPVIPVPGVAIPVVPAPTALTFGQATKALCGLRPGAYQMWFIHPVTNCPVCAKFVIRKNCVVDVSSNKWFGNYRLVLKVPGLGNDVALKFKKDGSVVVAE